MYFRKFFSVLLSITLIITSFNLLPAQHSVFAADTDVISFPDSNLKAALIQTGVDTNGDGNITQAELKAQSSIYLNGLTATNISNLSGMEYATGLQTFELTSSKVSDLTPLSNLTSMSSLTLNYNQISDLTPLANMTSMASLHVIDNPISSFVPLSGLSSLMSLSVSFQNDLVLPSLSGLRNLNIGSYKKASGSLTISGSSFPKLISLMVDNVDLGDLNFLSSFSNLNWLSLKNCNLTEISAISGLTRLTSLDLNNNLIADLSPLTNLSSLNALNVSYNCLDLSPGSSAMNVINAHQSRNCSVIYANQEPNTYSVTGSLSIEGGGVPAEGTILTIYTSDNTFVKSTTIGSSGTFAVHKLASGTYRLSIVAGPHHKAAETTFTIQSANAAVNFTVPKAYSISGKISMQDGSALQHNQYSVTVRNSLASMPIWATISADGNYTVYGLEPGSYTLSVQTSTGGNLIVEKTVTITASDVVENIAIPKTYTLSGSLSMENGGNLPDTYINVYATNQSSGSSGMTYWGFVDKVNQKYTINGLIAGDYKINCQLNSNIIKSLESTIQITSSDVVHNLVLPKTYSIQPIVTVVDGSPLPDNLYIGAEDEAGNSFWEQRDSSGNHLGIHGVIPGKYKVFAYIQYGKHLVEGEVTVTDSDVSIQLVVPRTYTVSGTVKTIEGNDIEYPSVVVSTDTYTSYWNNWNSQTKKYTISGVLPGEYNISAYAGSDYIPSESKKITITNADLVENFVLQRAYSISGKISLSNGSITSMYPNFEAVDANGQKHWVSFTDYGSSYRFSHLLPGEYTIQLSEYEKRFKPFQQKVTITAANEVLDITLELLPTLYVNVKLPDGSIPPSEHYFYLSAQDQSGTWFGNSYKVADGKFAIYGLPAGSYKLFVSSSNVMYLNHESNVSFSGSDMEMDVTLERGYTITMNLTTSDGKLIEIPYSIFGYWQYLPRLTATDVTGKIHYLSYNYQDNKIKFYGLKTGEYKIAVSDWESRYEKTEMTAQIVNDDLVLDMVLTKRPALTGTITIPGMADGNQNLKQVNVQATGQNGTTYYANIYYSSFASYDSQKGIPYEIPGLPVGEYKVRAIGYESSPEGYITDYASELISVTMNDTGTIQDLEMAKAYKISLIPKLEQGSFPIYTSIPFIATDSAGNSYSSTFVMYDETMSEMQGRSMAIFHYLKPGVYKIALSAWETRYSADSITVTISDSSQEAIINLKEKNTGLSISGNLTLNSGGAPSAYTCIVATRTDGRIFYGYSNSAGYYMINYLEPGEYRVSLPSYENRYSMAEQSISLTNASVVQNFTLTKAADLRGTATKDGIGAYKATIGLWKKNGSEYTKIASAISGTAGFSFDSVINSIGDYKLTIDSIQNKNSTTPEFEYAPVYFTVTNPTGIIQYNLTYNDPSNLNISFDGEGNSVVPDVKVSSNNKNINLKINYKYYGNTPVRPTFKIVLPEGLEFKNSPDGSVMHQETHTPNKDLNYGDSGSHTAAIRINNPSYDIAQIKVFISVDNGQTWNDFGKADVAIEKVSLNGPGAIKTGEYAKVYGDAAEESLVQIKNFITGEVLASAITNGRFYAADIGPFPEGIHTIVAEIELGGVIQSNKLNIDVRESQITIVDVKKDGITLHKNAILGVRTFSNWVDMSLKGVSFIIEVDFENAADIERVTFKFSDETYYGSISGSTVTANISNWYGAGLKPLEATVDTKDGRQLHFVIAEATILIDPSGVVTDSQTGLPIEGVTMTCYELDASGNWILWNAEKYAQENPMLTDKEGKYGWMVPEGKYKVTASKSGYMPYDTMNDPLYSSNNQTTIIIPPPRDDVHIRMQRIDSPVLPTPIPTPVPGPIYYPPLADMSSSTENAPVTTQVDAQSKQATVIWSTVQASILKAKLGDTIDVDMKDEIFVPVTVFKALKGKDVTLRLLMNGYTWTINGKNVQNIPSNVKEYNLAVGKLGTTNLFADNKDILSIIFNQEKYPFKAILSTKPDFQEDLPEGTLLYLYIYDGVLRYRSEIMVGKDGIILINYEPSGHFVFAAEILQNAHVSIPARTDDKYSYVPVYMSGTSEEIVKRSSIINGKLSFTAPKTGVYEYKNNYKTFLDTADHWSAENISFTTARELLVGVGNKLFAPNEYMTSSMLIAVLGRIANTDIVASDLWYQGYVDWASTNGMLNGLQAFDPLQPISRQDMAIVIANFLQYMDVNVPSEKAILPFIDSDAIAPSAKESITLMQKAGILVGRPSAKAESTYEFDPTGILTRAETCSVLKKLIDTLVIY